MNDIHILFSLRGRLNRLRYFLYTIGLMIFQGIATSLIAPMAISGSSSGRLFMPLIIVAIELVLAWCWAALMVKRMHDLDRSGWYVVFFVVILVVFSAVFADPRIAVALIVLVGILSLVSGTKGENRYGRDPFSKGVAQTASATDADP